MQRAGRRLNGTEQILRKRLLDQRQAGFPGAPADRRIRVPGEEKDRHIHTALAQLMINSYEVVRLES